jgi:hypothetical protein
MKPVDCSLCKENRMSWRSIPRYGTLVIRLSQVGMVAGLAILATGICGYLGIRVIQPESTLALVTTFGVGLGLLILGALGTSRRSVLWCKTCGAVSDIVVDAT